MAHRDFDRDRDPIRPDEKGPTFTLCEQTFECMPRLPARVMAKVTQAVTWDEGSGKRAVPDIIEGIRGALIRKRWMPGQAAENDSVEVGESIRSHVAGDEPGRWVDADDVRRFDDVINGTDDVVDTETLGQVLEFLLEEYGKRPTKRSRR